MVTPLYLLDGCQDTVSPSDVLSPCDRQPFVAVDETAIDLSQTAGYRFERVQILCHDGVKVKVSPLLQTMTAATLTPWA